MVIQFKANVLKNLPLLDTLLLKKINRVLIGRHLVFKNITFRVVIFPPGTKVLLNAKNANLK